MDDGRNLKEPETQLNGLKTNALAKNPSHFPKNKKGDQYASLTMLW
jgi:hypothetical protein